MRVNQFFSGMGPRAWYSSAMFGPSPGSGISSSSLNNVIFSSVSGKTDARTFSYQSDSSRLVSLNALYSEASSALDIIKQLSADNPKSVFYKKAATSSNSDVVEISNYNSYDNDYGTTASEPSYEPDLSNSTRKIINIGSFLKPDERSVVDTGINRFSLTVASITHDISFDEKFGDTNKTALTKMAAGINKTGSGVTASVEKGPNDTVYLKLSGQTNKINSFSLKDMEGNAVSSTHEYGNTGSDSSYEFDISTKAKEQINKGDFLDSDKSSAINAGANQLTLTVSSAPHTISFNVDSGDTNKTALNKMAEAINSAETGVAANAVSLEGSAFTYLQLTGPTGSSNSFSIADVSGNSVSVSGAGDSAQSVADASYQLNNNQYTKGDNSVYLQDGLLEVNIADTRKATVTVGHDTESRVEAVHSFVNSINRITGFLKSNAHLKSDLESKWSQLVSDAASSMAKYGIKMGSNMKLSLDKGELSSKLKENLISVRETIGGKNGLAAQVEPFLSEVVSSPGADLLSSQPDSNFATIYFRAATSKTPSASVPSTFSTVA